jgi:ABC-type molybdate transport system substrate-binding protein
MPSPRRRTTRLAQPALLLALCGAATAQAQPAEVLVHAAGSLREALTDTAKAFEQQASGVKLKFSFGASGLLKDRLAAGERSEVFASANLSHPQALQTEGRAGPVQRFARNTLCALARQDLAVSPDTLVQRMLDPAVKMGTSTPKADPAGDYTWQMFDRIEQAGRPGAAQALAAKALQLTGGPNSPPPPAGRNVYGVLTASGAADLFITYCTNAVSAVREEPTLRVVAVPDAINVSAAYGVTLINGASPLASRYVDFLLGPDGQAVLARHGFAPR